MITIINEKYIFYCPNFFVIFFSINDDKGTFIAKLTERKSEKCDLKL